MNTSAAAIEDTVYVAMKRFSLGAGYCPAGNSEKGIVPQVKWGNDGHRFQTRGGAAAVREHKPLAFSNSPKNAFSVLPKL
jgi:hypothetical protein